MSPEPLDFRTSDPQLYRDEWQGGKMRTVLFYGRCVACGRRTYGFSDEPKPDFRGVLGDHTNSALEASDYGMAGPDVPLCAVCANDSAAYRSALNMATKQRWKQSRTNPRRRYRRRRGQDRRGRPNPEFAPGTLVGSDRRPFGDGSHAGGRPWSGVVLARDDPRAWRGTLYAGRRNRFRPGELAAHVASHGGMRDRLPVLWEFGKVYWEDASKLVPYAQDAIAWRRKVKAGGHRPWPVGFAGLTDRRGTISRAKSRLGAAGLERELDRRHPERVEHRRFMERLKSERLARSNPILSVISNPARELVLWGVHPSYAGGIPLKIAGGGSARELRREQRYRERMGWRTVIAPRGHTPKGLARANPGGGGARIEVYAQAGGTFGYEIVGVQMDVRERLGSGYATRGAAMADALSVARRYGLLPTGSARRRRRSR